MAKKLSSIIGTPEEYGQYLDWFIYEYERPAVTVDAVCLYNGLINTEVLLIKRKNNPYKNHYALPGGFLEIDETAEQAVRRELLEETGVKATDVIHLGVYDDVLRDTRTRVISIAFLVIFSQKPEIIAGDDAAEAEWMSIADAKKHKLAFDHDQILKKGLNELQLQHDSSRW